MRRIPLLLIPLWLLLPAISFAADKNMQMAHILFLEDSRASADKIEPYTSPENDIEVRRMAVIALGAVGDPDACDALLLHLSDPEPRIAVAAAKALGNLWYPNRLGDATNPPDDRALDELEKLIFKDFDAQTYENGELLRNEAIKSFGMIARDKRARPLIRFLGGALESQTGGIRIEQIKSALVSLFLARPPKSRETATKALEHANAEVRRYAAVTLGRLRQAQAIPALNKALADENLHVRAEAARALGRYGGTNETDLLFTMLYSSMDEEIIGALAGYGKGMRGVNVVRCAEMLAELKKPEDVRPMHLAIIDALGRRGDDDAITLLKTQLRRKGAIRTRTLAALGACRAAHVLLGLNAESFAGDHLAAAAYAQALADCRLPNAAARLRDIYTNPLKPTPYRFERRGKAALLAAALQARIDEALKYLPQDIESDDPLIREIACDHVAENPDVILFQAVIRSLDKSAAKSDVMASLSALKAIEKIGDQFKGHNPIRRQILEKAKELISHRNLLIRTQAARLVRAYAGEYHKNAFFNSKTGRPNAYYEDMAAGISKTRLYKVRTNKGGFELRVNAWDAPLCAARFSELVLDKFYDGVIVHRVEPNFVMQTGDPLGTGWGGSGVMIRDETGRLPFEAYTLGLATAGHDTGDSQWFITHLPTPHLNGAYTAFGKVASGRDVVNKIVIGDVILQVVEVSEKETAKSSAPADKPEKESTANGMDKTF